MLQHRRPSLSVVPGIDAADETLFQQTRSFIAFCLSRSALPSQNYRQTPGLAAFLKLEKKHTVRQKFYVFGCEPLGEAAVIILYVCLSVCLSLCLFAQNPRNHWSKTDETLCEYLLRWPYRSDCIFVTFDLVQPFSYFLDKNILSIISKSTGHFSKQFYVMT